MNPAHHQRLVIAVDAGATPITGCLTDTAGASHAFDGWIGLLTVLEEAIEPPPDPVPARQGRSEP